MYAYATDIFLSTIINSYLFQEHSFEITVKYSIQSLGSAELSTGGLFERSCFSLTSIQNLLTNDDQT